MKTTEWLNHYYVICKKLGIDPAKDRQAAEILSNLIRDVCVSRADVAEFFAGRNFAVVFGAASSLEEDLEDFLESFDCERAAIVVADGAVRAFLDLGVRPDVVVTDLDGGDEALLCVATTSRFFVVHAHGDNISKIQHLVPKLDTKVLGTTQTEPVGVLDNFGGFTDGDRAVFLCEELGVKTIVVAGMDFDGEIGKFSKPYLLDEKEKMRKKLKLQIGKSLLEILATKTNAALYDASKTNSVIRGFQKIVWRELVERLCRLK
ncbi:MAG: 6-hydroxymethylpterin diphosphokinase MptE-like protein [Candidatus Caldarchaeum sp.]